MNGINFNHLYKNDIFVNVSNIDDKGNTDRIFIIHEEKIATYICSQNEKNNLIKFIKCVDIPNDAKINKKKDSYITNKAKIGIPIDVWKNYSLCESILEKNGMMLEYVKIQNDELNRIAVKNNGLALKYIKNKSMEICNIAIKQNADSFKYIANRKITDRIYYNKIMSIGIVCLYGALSMYVIITHKN